MSDQNIRILIAEDDFLVCEEIKRIMRDSRYSIIGEASNGEEAVEMAAALKPDVILMDIRMPKMNGLEASRKISEQHPLPIVILTAYESPELVEQASESGVGAFLGKPPQFAELDRSITIALARHNDLVEMRRLNKELQDALDEIKTLKGILPICAKCHNIRDDEGYWHRVEDYITNHSDAVLSHSMCKKCSDEMYGGLEWYEEGKKKGEISFS